MPFRVINPEEYLTDEARAYLMEHGCEVQDTYLKPMNEEELRAQVPGIDAALAGGEHWSEMVFEAADRLRIVARLGTGIDHVDLDAAAKHGVVVTNTPEPTSNAVADFTLGLMLSLLRNIPAMACDMKNGVWKPFLGREFHNLLVGVVGTGHIGREVVVRMRALGAKVLAYDIRPNRGLAERWSIQYVDLDELVSQCDIVTLHVPLTDETRGLIDRRRLSLMKSEAYLINTSRSAVVDKEALVEALRGQHFSGAAIDVHDRVPCAPDDPLLMLDNVIATPWSASNTYESVAAMCITAAKDIVAVLTGGKPQHPVRP